MDDQAGYRYIKINGLANAKQYVLNAPQLVVLESWRSVIVQTFPPKRESRLEERAGKNRARRI
jgi:hypothetical protein